MTTHHTRAAITLAALIVAAGLMGCPSEPKPFEPMVDAAVQAEMGPGMAGDAARPAEDASRSVEMDAGEGCVSSAEVCDGVDNDCDGIIDVNTTDDEGPCTAGVGDCARNGVLRCVNGDLLCDAVPGGGTDEVCDGVDNDCDGVVDNLDGATCCDGSPAPAAPALGPSRG